MRLLILIQSLALFSTKVSLGEILGFLIYTCTRKLKEYMIKQRERKKKQREGKKIIIPHPNLMNILAVHSTPLKFVFSLGPCLVPTTPPPSSRQRPLRGLLLRVLEPNNLGLGAGLAQSGPSPAITHGEADWPATPASTWRPIDSLVVSPSCPRLFSPLSGTYCEKGKGWMIGVKGWGSGGVQGKRKKR